MVRPVLVRQPLQRAYRRTAFYGYAADVDGVIVVRANPDLRCNRYAVLPVVVIIRLRVAIHYLHDHAVCHCMAAKSVVG